MRNLKFIKSFVFNYAQYEIADENSNRGILNVNYRDNKFTIEDISGKFSKKLISETTKVAKDLLQRKHGVNFANK